MYVCIFTIATYGISGNELPPPVVRSFSRAVLSGHGDTDPAFRARMQEEGVAIRRMLDERFKEEPKPYSCADSVSWSIIEAGSITGIVSRILSDDAVTQDKRGTP